MGEVFNPATAYNRRTNSPRFVFRRNTAAATFEFKDKDGTFSAFLAGRGYCGEAEAWRTAGVEYHVDVKGLKGDTNTPFAVDESEKERVRVSQDHAASSPVQVRGTSRRHKIRA
jgi:hypothetical protein